MIVTAEATARNQRQALVAAALVAWAAGLLVWLSPPLWLLLGLSPFTYWWVRRRYLRRVAVVQQPFPDQWERILRVQVAFFVGSAARMADDIFIAKIPREVVSRHRDAD